MIQWGYILCGILIGTALGIVIGAVIMGSGRKATW
jgi:hypothetical protein